MKQFVFTAVCHLPHLAQVLTRFNNQTETLHFMCSMVHLHCDNIQAGVVIHGDQLILIENVH